MFNKNLFFELCIIILVIIFALSGCNNTSENSDVSIEYKLYNLDDISLYTKDETDTNNWIQYSDTSSGNNINRINFFIDCSYEMNQFYSNESNASSIGIIEELKSISLNSSNLNSDSFHSYMYVGNIHKNFYVRELTNYSEGSTLETSYKPFENQDYLGYVNIQFSNKSNKTLVRSEFSSLKSSLWDLLEEIYLYEDVIVDETTNQYGCLYSDDSSSNQATSTINIIFSTFNFTTDEDFKEFTTNINQFFDRDIFYGLICLDTETGLTALCFGSKDNVNNLIEEFEYSIQDSNFDCSNIKTIYPNFDSTTKTSTIDSSISNNLYFDDITDFIEISTLSNHSDYSSYQSISNNQQVIDSISYNIYPLEYVNNLSNDLSGNFKITFPFEHHENSWIKILEWELSYNITCVCGEECINLNTIPSFYTKKLEELQLEDVSISKFNYLKDILLTNERGLNAGNIEDWTIVSEEYDNSYTIESINNDIFNIISVDNSEDNTSFVLNYKLETENMDIDIPYLFNIQIQILPKYEIKDIPEWAQGNDMYENLITPLIRYCEEYYSIECEPFLRQSLTSIEKTQDLLSEEKITELCAKGYSFKSSEKTIDKEETEEEQVYEETLEVEQSTDSAFLSWLARILENN